MLTLITYVKRFHMFQARPNTWIAKISFCTEDGAGLTFENRFSPVRTTQYLFLTEFKGRTVNIYYISLSWNQARGTEAVGYN